jgi:hypothetical protein
MVPLLAIFAVVLIGCTAIAADLSVSTHYKRNLQNVADSASLAGAKQLPAPASITSASQAAAAEAAVEVIHNAFPFSTGGDPNWAKNLVETHSLCGGAVKSCSVTACVNLTNPACTATWQQYSPAGVPPFSFTVNTPPKTAAVAAFNTCCAGSYYERVEVVMHQQSGAFFAGIFGLGGNIAGAQAVALHYAGSQGFPFALFSNTVIGDGNSNEIISGNVYAARYLNPQSSGQAAVCASNDANGNPGYIVLGAPQQGDSGYADDGQDNDQTVTKSAWTIQDSVSDCTAMQQGTVGMTANPANCSSAFAGTIANASIGTDSIGDACEANPALQDPNVQAPPNIPTYAGTQCESVVTTPSVVDPTKGGFQCSGGTYKNGMPSLTIDSAHVSNMTPGIYEVLPSNNSPCDVTIDGTYPQLTGVTFYLEQGAGICMNPPVGTTIAQSPYCGSCSGGSATQGDGIYDVLSDNVGTPTITMSTGGSSSGAGVWEVFGTIWLPTGTVNVGNKDAIQDDGQILVNVWNDQSGYHPTDSVTYNGSYVPAQKEILQLVE